MKRNISSSLTFFYKFIFSTIWVGGFGFGTLLILLKKDSDSIPFLVAWILGSICIYSWCVRLKRVELDDEYMYISNFFKTISVPLTEITKVTEWVYINIHPIRLTFENKTEFGWSIMFMPPFSWSFCFFMSHPIAKELRLLIEHKSSD